MLQFYSLTEIHQYEEKIFCFYSLRKINADKK